MENEVGREGGRGTVEFPSCCGGHHVMTYGINAAAATLT